MNANPPGTISCAFIDSVHGINDRLHPLAAELIAKNIKADFFIRCIKGSNSCCNTLDRTTIAEGLPGTQPGNNGPATRRCIGNLFSSVLRKHIFAHIVHYLNALDLRIYVQGFS